LEGTFITWGDRVRDCGVNSHVKNGSESVTLNFYHASLDLQDLWWGNCLFVCFSILSECLLVCINFIFVCFYCIFDCLFVPVQYLIVCIGLMSWFPLNFQIVWVKVRAIILQVLFVVPFHRLWSVISWCFLEQSNVN